MWKVTVWMYDEKKWPNIILSSRNLTFIESFIIASVEGGSNSLFYLYLYFYHMLRIRQFKFCFVMFIWFHSVVPYKGDYGVGYCIVSWCKILWRYQKNCLNRDVVIDNLHELHVMKAVEENLFDFNIQKVRPTNPWLSVENALFASKGAMK